MDRDKKITLPDGEVKMHIVVEFLASQIQGILGNNRFLLLISPDGDVSEESAFCTNASPDSVVRVLRGIADNIEKNPNGCDKVYPTENVTIQ